MILIRKIISSIVPNLFLPNLFMFPVGLITLAESGPPDLEESINRFIRKLSGKKRQMDAFRRDGGGPDTGNDNFGQVPLALIVLIILNNLTVWNFAYWFLYS